MKKCINLAKTKTEARQGAALAIVLWAWQAILIDTRFSRLPHALLPYTLSIQDYCFTKPSRYLLTCLTLSLPRIRLLHSQLIQDTFQAQTCVGLQVCLADQA